MSRNLKKTSVALAELMSPTVCTYLVALMTSVIFAPLGATELTIRAYDSAPLAKKSEYRGYVTGVASAFGWVNAHNENRGLPALFCAPDQSRLSSKFYQNLIEEEIAAAKANPDLTVYEQRTVSHSILIGLKRRFPCPYFRAVNATY